MYIFIISWNYWVDLLNERDYRRRSPPKSPYATYYKKLSGATSKIVNQVNRLVSDFPDTNIARDTSSNTRGRSSSRNILADEFGEEPCGGVAGECSAIGHDISDAATAEGGWATGGGRAGRDIEKFSLVSGRLGSDGGSDVGENIALYENVTANMDVERMTT
jgi:hypothetical protein